MKVPDLDPRFGKLVALCESTTHDGERDAARRKAEALLAPDVGGFDRAVRILAYQNARQASPNNMFAGFEEHTEIDNPGHMARQAAERAEKLRKRQEHRLALVVRYGSLDAVLAPCAREKMIVAAVRPWRKAGEPPHQRWTWDLEGWSYADPLDKMSPDLRAAIKGAYPMPSTFAEAREELAYWRERNADMEHALSEDGTGLSDYGLDKVGLVRMFLLQELVEHEIRLFTLPEIVERFRIYRDREIDERGIEAALFRDLEALEKGVPK